MSEFISTHHTITFLNAAGQTAASLRAGTVRVEADYAVLDPKLAPDCSLVGRVTQVGQEVDSLRIGDYVIALGTPAASLVLPADNCLKLPQAAPVTAEIAYCALTLTLLPIIRYSQLEIGETVLVLGSGLVGQMLSQLVLAAGARLCAGFDPEFLPVADQATETSPRPSPLWLADKQALEVVLPKNGVDLLIDASGDPAILASCLGRVASAGRVLLASHYSSPALEFDVYPDLHKRSIKVLSGHMANSLREVKPNHAARLVSARQNLGFILHLYQSGRLRPSLWPVTRLQAPAADTVAQAVQTTRNSALFIEW